MNPALKGIWEHILDLGGDGERTIRWAFAQAVLSALWEIEDGAKVDATNSSLRLAEAIRPML